jgi:hypothetical protein
MRMILDDLLRLEQHAEAPTRADGFKVMSPFEAFAQP